MATLNNQATCLSSTETTLEASRCGLSKRSRSWWCVCAGTLLPSQLQPAEGRTTFLPFAFASWHGIDGTRSQLISPTAIPGEAEWQATSSRDAKPKGTCCRLSLHVVVETGPFRGCTRYPSGLVHRCTPVLGWYSRAGNGAPCCGFARVGVATVCRSVASWGVVRPISRRRRLESVGDEC